MNPKKILYNTAISVQPPFIIPLIDMLLTSVTSETNDLDFIPTTYLNA